MRFLWTFLFSILLFISSSAYSSEGGESPYAKMETLTVNLQGLAQYLQVDMSLKVANPKVTESIKSWNPVIRHELILLLGSQSADELATLAGKKKLASQIRSAINKVLKLGTNEGVTDVLFESFVIQ